MTFKRVATALLSRVSRAKRVIPGGRHGRGRGTLGLLARLGSDGHKKSKPPAPDPV